MQPQGFVDKQRTVWHVALDSDEESEHLLRGYLSGELYKRGLICRADDRGDPVIQLAPPLISDTEQFEEIHDVLRAVLTEAWDQVVS